MLSDRVRLARKEVEIRLFNNRLLWTGGFIFLMVCVLLGRLYYLQVMHHSVYSTLSTDNQLTVVRVAPTRGLIYDRRGVLLADNVPSFNLEIIPEKVKNFKNTLARLREIIPITEEELEYYYKQRKYRRRFESTPIKYKLNEKEMATFAVNKYKFPGVLIKSKPIRHYSHDTTFAHIVGYVSRINERELGMQDPSEYDGSDYIGKTGIEKFYEKALHGKSGSQQVEVDASGRPIRVIENIPPVAGKNIYLTIDARLQMTAQEIFQGKKGAIVAVDPGNGEILAMFSNPSFDPNEFAKGMEPKRYKQLVRDPAKPLYHRATRGHYPPASTIKPIIALQALDKNLVKPYKRIFDPGFFRLPGHSHKYRDWRAHGLVDLHKAIVISCNTYFYDLSHRIGIKNIAEILHAVGYGQKSGIDIYEESPGVVPSPTWKKTITHEPWYPGDTVVTGIGHGYALITPLQVALASAAISMHGMRFKPHLVYKTLDDKHIEFTPVTPLEPVKLKESTWNFVIKAMRDVTMHGTAARFGYGAQYTSAGKTGTAQLFELEQHEKYRAHRVEKNLRDHSLFMVFAPIEHPKIAVAVVGENDKRLAKTAARKLIDAYLIDIPKENAKQNHEGAPLQHQNDHNREDPLFNFKRQKRPRR